MSWTTATSVGLRQGPRIAMLATGTFGFVLGVVLGTRNDELLPALQAIAGPAAALFAVLAIMFVLSLIVVFVVDLVEVRHRRWPQGEQGVRTGTVAASLKKLLEEIAIGRAAVRRFEQLYADVMSNPRDRFARPIRSRPRLFESPPSQRKVEPAGTSGRLEIAEVH